MAPASRRLTFGLFIAIGLLVAAALAFVVAPHASSAPDGLEKVALDQGFANDATPHAIDGSPTADYALDGVDDEPTATGLAGLIGVAVTFGVCAGGVWLMRRASPDATIEPEPDLDAMTS